MGELISFFQTFFATYDITTEVIILLLDIILFLIIWISKPENTHMLKICVMGILMSIMAILEHISFLAHTIELVDEFDYMLATVSYISFGAFFITALNLIYAYISQLSYKRRMQRHKFIVMIILLSIVGMTIFIRPLLQGTLLETVNGKTVLGRGANDYVYVSVLYTVVCWLSVIFNRNNLARVVFYGGMVFFPIVALGVCSQFYFPTAYFICATYSIPFFIFYMLFHAYGYDEVMGCQSYAAESSLIQRYIEKKKHFIFLSVSFPKLATRDMKSLEHVMHYVGNAICRKAEKVNGNIRIYKVSDTHYQVLCPVIFNNIFNQYENVTSQLLEIVSEPVEMDGVTYKTPTNIIISRDFPEIQDGQEYLNIVARKLRSIGEHVNDVIQWITEEDIAGYQKQIEIEKNLLDIKNKKDLDDERVIVYVQPIYCIGQDSFRTGESLMRMKLDGKMVFPDQFIPVAEDIDCIHALTRIMLNKVSKKVAELSKNHDFDALTVNVSTVELTDPNAADEFLEIIKNAGANPEQICLEITESTSIESYDMIIDNIVRMNEKGVRFYLDDFGTGYSNIDRIVSIPFKNIKFDKSLLYKALEDKKSEELFLMLLKFFGANGFDTVIEGVEDEAQMQYVKEHGFDFIQGYYYSKPLPESEVDGFYVDKK